MKVSYNWLKWYIPECPEADKLADVITYHIAEVESVEKLPDGDSVLDIKILPNRAHDLLSHQGVARELASLLNISFVDPTPKYKIPESKSTELKINIETDACKRYMGRIVRNVKVGPSPEWVVKHLESVGQRSINNIVDASNIVLLDCGNPTHVFDLDKMQSEIVIRDAQDGEEITTLDNRLMKLKSSHIVVTDTKNLLEIGGLKGGKTAEVDTNTKNIILEVSSFKPVPVRKMSVDLGLRTEGSKRHENDFSPELDAYAMREFSALVMEMCPEAMFEDIVDVYPVKQTERKLNFSAERISKILGLEVSVAEIEDILKRYNFSYTNKGGDFEIVVPTMRLDLVCEEDMAEEVGRIIGYDKLQNSIPKINFTPKVNETYAKITWARNKLLSDGFSEVMTYAFRDKGEVEVMQSASDKKFLRTNLADGLTESLKLNKLNAPLLGMKEIKIFEVGTVFNNTGEEVHVAYNEKNKIIEMNLEDFCKKFPMGVSAQDFLLHSVNHSQIHSQETSEKFKMWSLFPFIARDVAVWVPESVKSEDVEKIIKDNIGDMVVRGPELFDEFKKEGKVSYAFRMVFQSYDRTLTDAEINTIMEKISEKLTENPDWQVR